MVKDIWKGLKFEKTDTVFTDNRKKLDAYLEGSFTRAEIADKLQELSNELHNKNRSGYIGVSIHYGFPNAWLPAIFTKYGDQIKLFDPDDSDTTQDFDDIDGLCFMIIENHDLNQSMFHRAKKNKTKNKAIP